jgi:hypothetical protein
MQIAYSRKDYKGALKIAKDFFYGLTKEQKSTVTRAYECYVWPHIYKQLGKDLREYKILGVEVLEEVYGLKQSKRDAGAREYIK